DGHDGTDFAIRDERAMAAGVAVVAAAPGTVRSVRDGMPDIGRNGDIAGRECGNGVLVAHEEGWETQYCHMRRGSVVVRPGERVERGQTLGLVGLSGNTEFPHLHLTVRRDRRPVDPFLGDEAFGACRISASSLWMPEARAALAYRPIAIYNAGFSGTPPDAATIRRGERALPSVNSEALVLWTDIFGVDRGDRIQLRILDPDGEVLLDHARTLDKRFIRRFEFAGKRKQAEPWPPGTYTGEIAVTRSAGEQATTVTNRTWIELR
ncbi:MAG TPA: M23 family metallopeptidase, partial [Vicinamibacterales bacterium]|nr:M23 family metallopeptidase [Vicinamibacterales bacterium]